VFAGKVPLDKIKGYEHDIFRKNLNWVFDIFYRNNFPLEVAKICLSYVDIE